jgi:hypothetical protein
MSNLSRCLERAIRYQELAEAAREPRVRRTCIELARLWREMAPLAAAVDRRSDSRARERLYAMIDVVEQVRRQAA